MIKTQFQNELDTSLSKIPNDKYRIFFAKFAEIDTLPTEEWKKVHLLGYFCRLYQQTYQIEYPWKFNHPSPTKCFEMWQLNTLGAKLSTNPKIVKEYFDWVYQNIVPQAKRRLTSISFLTKDEVVNPYKMNILLGRKEEIKIDRTTALPSSYQKVFQQINASITTYGELAFVSKMKTTSQFQQALDQLQELGFDPTILERII
jgi:hypothetical protein